MSSRNSFFTIEDWELTRRLAHIQSRDDGPTLVVISGMHGNEPAGVVATRRVVETLTPRSHHLRGDFLALLGNVSAVGRRIRYVARDLNRLWMPEQIEKLRDADSDLYAEDRELVELLEEIERAAKRSRGNLLLLDLHTMSSSSSTFIASGSEDDSRELGQHFPVPHIVGLSRHLDGTMLEYCADLGYLGLVVEGGSHYAPDSVDAIESAIWISMSLTGMISDDRWPEVRRSREYLSARSGSMPRSYEVRYRHPVDPQDHFKMLPGFHNLRSVGAGEVVAHDARGPVRAPEAGMLLMPLYQDMGEDGFFLVREI